MTGPGDREQAVGYEMGDDGTCLVEVAKAR